MRFAGPVAVVVALVLLDACVSDQLALVPPPGVDFSGYWRLNVEESDDPLHLIQSQNVDPSKTPGSQGQGGPGGRGGRGRGGGGFSGGTTFAGPATPPVGTLSEAMRWPGNDVEIKQVAGVVAITSAGVNQVCQPTNGGTLHIHRKAHDDEGGGGRDRDMPARGRSRPLTCGWDQKTLVVQPGETDEDRPSYETRYSVSADGEQLIEIVGFMGGRSNGFTLSRTWDRADPNAPPRPPVVRPAAPEGIRPDSYGGNAAR